MATFSEGMTERKGETTVMDLDAFIAKVCDEIATRAHE